MAIQFSKRIQSPLRRQSVSSSHGTPENMTPELMPNDDESERRQRRLSLMIERQISQSPRGSYNPIADLNAVQLAEHYTKCMRLSTQNKINSKNAFQLQLIDYMAMMLKKKEPQMDNFQVASCTLDASAKIYACRVDNVYNDAYKLAAGFSRAGNAKNKAGNDMSAMEEEIGTMTTQPGKRSKTRRSSMIEKNLGRINLKERELCGKVDPYFRRMITKFDEGQCGGCHLLQGLRLLDDSQEYILASDVTWWREHPPKVQKPSASVKVPSLNFNAINSSEICPSFSSFTFVGWKPELDNDITCSSKSENFDTSQVLGRDAEHAFDMNAVPENVPLNGDDDLSEVASDDLESVEKLGCHDKGKKSSWEYVSLRKSLSLEPQEYSYFNKAAQVGWSGPTHWKVQPILRKNLDGRASQRKKLNDVTFLDYDEVNNDDFEVSNKNICLKAATINAWNNERITLPQDMNIYPSALSRLFLMPKMTWKPQDTSAVIVDGVDPFNFENTNDHENYCSNEVILENDNESDDDIWELHELGLSPLPDVHKLATAESGYDLVPAPNMVPIFNISYVKLPKRLNMRRLQEVIYKLVTTNDKSQPDAAANNEVMEVVRETFKLTDIYKKIPAKLSSREVRNLSIQIAFVALLHVASSKNLQLQGQNDLLDVTISHAVQSQKLNSPPQSLSLP